MTIAESVGKLKLYHKQQSSIKLLEGVHPLASHNEYIKQLYATMLSSVVQYGETPTREQLSLLQSILKSLQLDGDLNMLLRKSRNITESTIEEFKIESSKYIEFFLIESIVLVLSDMKKSPKKWAYFNDIIHILGVSESRFGEMLDRAKLILEDEQTNYYTHLNKL